MVRKFLYFITFMIVLVIGAGFTLNIWSNELTEVAMVPTADFVEQQPLDVNAYQKTDMWYSRPGIGTNDPVRWQPATRGETRDESLSAPDAAGDAPPFAVFFVHPTSYINREAWNAPLGDADAERIARIQIRGMGSAFNRASEIWAPRYRQATIGAFLRDSPEAANALNAAYTDVKQAFDFFIGTVDDDTPIVLVGHSQGSVHLLRLMKDELAGKPVAGRVAAIYAIGWPISIEHDLPALGFPACATAAQPGCVLSWSSYAEPAEPEYMLEKYATSIGFDGQARGSSPVLCTNPLTGRIGGEAPASANLGTLVPAADFSTGELISGSVSARCNDRGVLLIGDPPELGSAVLPGNNYHVYDIPLFWANVQADVVGRVRSWTPQVQ